MLCNHFTEELLGLQGVKITNAEQEENLIIHLEPERKVKTPPLFKGGVSLNRRFS